MIWKNLTEGIKFENVDVFLPWKEPINRLKEFGHPEISNRSGWIDFVWNDTVLLNGIKGDWKISLLPSEMGGKMKSIGISYSGDKQSLEAYARLKTHLLDLLGNPSIQNENGQEKELKWENGNCYIYSYLFEMHALRCDLTIGIN